MQRVFAPWRMSYILSSAEQAGECIFCAQPAGGPAAYRAAGILVARPHAFVMMNRYPYTNGHLLIAPRRHVASPTALPEDEAVALARLLADSIDALHRALAPHGMNVGMNLGRAAGAGIDAHCHWHIVPRWNGDANHVAVISEVRVISEHLAATYERLLPHFRPLGEGPAESPGSEHA